MDRRNFLKTATVAGGAGLIQSRIAGDVYAQSPAKYFSVHPTVENNPDAVFIMKTNVRAKLDSVEKIAAGREFSESVFLPSQTPGIPLSHMIALKANMLLGKAPEGYPDDYLMGANTDVSFVEGVIDGMKNLGISGEKFHLRDTSGDERSLKEAGFRDMADRTGATLLASANVNRAPDECHWVDLPKGVIHRRIPYLWPYNAPDTFLLNIAKFKSHAMGLTLCCKNVQGMIAHPYQGFCGGYKGLYGRCERETINPKYMKTVEKSFNRHLKRGIPRWDKPGRAYMCGIGMETWVERTLDNVSASPMGLCVVEGIYGRDGSHGDGPHPPFNTGRRSRRGRAHDFMSNIIVFGKNPVHVDNIGHWLGGHEPGNFGLFHIALEKKMSKYLDPKEIPLFSWTDGNAAPAKLESFKRTPLMTTYLRKNYESQEEEVYHMCNEPYDYS